MSIAFTTVPSNAVASGVFVEQEAVQGSLGDLVIPQKIALFGQYNAGKTVTNYTPRLLNGPDEAASLYGVGSMLHLMAIKAFLQNGGVPVYAIPMPDDVSGTAAQGSITVSGTCTGSGVLALFIGGQKVQVPIALGDSASAVATKISTRLSASVNLPVTNSPSGAVVTLTAKFKGLTGNGITIVENLDPEDALQAPLGITLAISQPSGGLLNPNTTSAFDALGNTFFTQIAFPFTDSDNLGRLDSYWDTRISAEVKKPFIAMIGDVNLIATYQSAVTARNSAAETYVNVEGSPNIPFEIAAAAVSACSASASADVVRPWKNLQLKGIRSGGRPEFTWQQHNDTQLLGGGTTYPSTTGEIYIKDLVTTYKTNALGAEDDSLRYPETIANYQAKVYSLDAMFLSEPFTRAVVIADGDVSSKSYVVSPSRVKGYLRRLVDELWIANNWSHSGDTIKASIITEINSGNPGRIDAQLTDVISTGLRIVAVKYQWAFTPAA